MWRSEAAEKREANAMAASLEGLYAYGFQLAKAPDMALLLMEVKADVNVNVDFCQCEGECACEYLSELPNPKETR